MKTENKNEIPQSQRYEATHDLKRLSVVISVVNEGLSSSIVKLLYEHEASSALIVRGKGTAQNDFYDVFGMSEATKDIIISVVKDEKWDEIKESLEQRFNLTQSSKGIAFTVPLDTVAGVSIYKMLANIKQFEKPKSIEKKHKKERKNGK